MTYGLQQATTARGRACPVSYRYRPEELGQPADLSCHTAYVVGGLYGNDVALQAILDRARAETPTPAIIFNGDFHYLDTDSATFAAINDEVLAHHATAGNIEAQLAHPEQGAGCGCAYPEYVDDGAVERSNSIVDRLQDTAGRCADQVDQLKSLPWHRTVEVGGLRVGVVHGDPESLAGWGLALEAMEPADAALRDQLGWSGTATAPEVVADWLRRAGLRVIASTHTGLPYAQDYMVDGQPQLVMNNGSAGLPNFADSRYGVITRLSADPRPPADSLYGISLGPLRCDALPVHFDLTRWLSHFLAEWPPGTPAYRSYFSRITHGTQLQLHQAARGSVTVAS